MPSIRAKSRADHHLRLGRLLLSSMNQQEIADRIFDVLNQLNLGSQLHVIIRLFVGRDGDGQINELLRIVGGDGDVD